MKTVILALAILFAGTATFAQTKKTVTHKHHKTITAKKYTCTMHPEVVQGKPGTCPKCGMKLVALKSKKTTAEKTETKL